ncbi:MAG TPA: 1-deoxy-D-xylulose-5-phosphate synthase [Tepidisphaeraceae bacterium]|jgi:1-deoxy-D-xylulose-5-phosphate synthase|nr:1-deoxy-D-xylulose-5-phosphate synthase [Tepidisphaeraceae bacterium]
MGLLESIHVPTDIRRLSMDELTALAAEIRDRIFQSVSKNGGHLASNLGVAELTIALHYVYDFGPFPTGPDCLLWDVGHQCYAHKMLTGRMEMFPTLRKKGSVGGFPNPDESAYDLFAVGHAGTAISTAVGMARGGDLMQKAGNVVAVVGDASIVNGLAFEGLNNAGTLRRQLLIVLNDNGMSISQPQGAFSQYLERIRVSTTYGEAKKLAEKFVGRLPATMGHTVEQVWRHVSDGVKSVLWPGQIFETMGIKYFGPVDGHDMPGMIDLLAEIKHVQAPVLLHLKTVKGNGYEIASAEPTKFHSPAAFEVNGCRVEIAKGPGKSWTTAFADAMIALAKRDPRVVALTAAMPDGTGLSKFEKEIPGRYFDTGICEGHLTAMAAGMAKAGMRPFAAIYSTFLQRAFDQVWQEVALNHLPVCFCMDRAGYVGDDGAVHHGFMDQAFLRPMPGIVLMAPSDEAELNRAVRLALSLDTISAIRYPRDTVPAKNFEEVIDPSLRKAAGGEWRVGRSRVLRAGADATVIVYGALAQNAMAAADELAADGLNVEVIDARFCKPVDGEMLSRVLRPGHPVLTLEDHSLQNGFGSAVAEHAVAHGLPTGSIVRLGMPDRLIAHASRPQQLAEVGLDSPGIVQSIRDAIKTAILIRTEQPAPAVEVSLHVPRSKKAMAGK